MPRKCNVCKRIWFSQADWCIDCGSKDIIWEYKEDTKQEDRE